MAITLLCDKKQKFEGAASAGCLEGGDGSENAIWPELSKSRERRAASNQNASPQPSRSVGIGMVRGSYVRPAIQSARAQPQSALASASSDANPAGTAPELPDSPELARLREQGSSAANPQAAQTDEGKQTKRILGIIPNFRSVSANTYLPPQTPKEKLIDVVHDSFDYSSFAFIGLLSTVSQLQGSTPEFHTGAPAYGRYYWHTFADQTDENLWVGFLLPVALHQDPRYYTLGSGSENKHNGFAKRAGYAFSRILVTRTDSGGSTFNFSEVVGAGASAGISNLYYPGSNRGWTKTGQRWVLNVSVDATTYVFKEFWPDLNRAIFHK